MPRWKDLKRYCERGNWDLYKETDHYYYRKVLEDGTVLRTKVSKGSGEIHYHLWREILNKQLKTTQEHINENIYQVDPKQVPISDLTGTSSQWK